MAAVVVALDGTRVNSSDSNTNWSKLNTGGGAPASEAQNAYQNALAVNVKNTNTATHGGLDYDYSGTGSIDATAATHPLFFMKIYVADFGALSATDAVQVRLGSSSTAYYYYIVAGTNANRSVYNTYPSQGGYILCAINMNISNWREGTGAGGAPTLTAIDYFAGTALFTTGAAKNENFAVDAIDAGRGLLLTRGDAGSTEAVFQDFVDLDQDTTTNRWGVVSSAGGIITSIGRLTVGESGTATEFTDDGTAIVVFPDGYYGVGDVGTDWNIENASTIISLAASQIIGRGVITTSDTRPDLTVTGTSGTFDIDGTIIKNHRNVTFTSVCDVTNADIECQLLTQNSANIDNSIIRTNSLTSVACLQDPTFGTTTDLNNVDFIQAGAGHAIELDTVGGTYTLTGITFSGYGAIASDDAALDITAATGTTTVNYSGTAPTYKTAGATVDLVATVDVNVHIEDTDQVDIEDAQVIISKNPATAYTSGAGNTAGDGDLVLTQTIDADVPQSSWAIVYDVSENLTLPYRFTSHDGANTLTFPTSVTGSATSLGTSTTLISTSTNFLTADIEEGDTIRNTTTGAYAVVDEIVDADNITTSALSSGVWGATDGFSVHDLATTLVSGTDTVDIPLALGQTDVNGDLATLAYKSSEVPTAVVVRARYSGSGTKYIPGKQNGTITASGLTINIALQEDTEA